MKIALALLSASLPFVYGARIGILRIGTPLTPSSKELASVVKRSLFDDEIQA